MNSPKPTTPQSTVGGIPVPLPNEEELAPHSLSDYAKNNPRSGLSRILMLLNLGKLGD